MRLSHETMMDLPERLCVLDVETEETVFARPERSKVALVGTKVYGLRGEAYEELDYRYYLEQETAQLEKFLKGLPGMVLGHNILEFDYRVIHPLLSLDGIIEKTVDLLVFLFKKNGDRFGGLSLNSLSKANLHEEKTLDGGAIPGLWKRGEHHLVVEYNETDCRLTKELWWRLVSAQSLKVEYYDRELQREIHRSLIASPEDIPYLLGRAPRFTFSEWEEKIDRGEHLMRR